MRINVKGSCLCNSVQFTISDPVQRFYTCYCSRCQKETGSAFAANLFTLFLAYEVLTLSTYPLVTHRGTPEAMASQTRFPC